MGHGSCGAVDATLQGKEVPGQIKALYTHIHPVVDLAGPELEETIKANAKIQAGLLREASTVISGLVKEGRVFARRFLNIASGFVSLLD
jgi:carbonic anhydrase